MPPLFKDWAIALGERPIANSSKVRRTVAASASLMRRSPRTTSRAASSFRTTA